MNSRLLSVLRVVAFCSALSLSSCEMELSTKTPTQSAAAAAAVSSSAKATPRDASAKITFIEGSTTTKEDPIPIIKTLEPSFGPLSGGTEVVLIGDYLNCSNGKLNATFDDSSELNCSLSTPLSVKCVTPAKSSPGSVTLHVACIEGNRKTLWMTESMQFTYRPDPEVQSIDPRASIISGGITQTIRGTNLDSAAQPKLIVSYGQERRMSWPCKRHQADNETVLMCRTGAVTVTGMNANDTARTRAKEIPSTVLDVSIGFIFDGFVQHSGSLRMFYDPAFDLFQPETKDFLTSEANLFTFAGAFPDFAFPKDDVRVQIGGKACVGVEINEDRVTCRAPVLPKPVIRYGPSELNTLDVTVSMGNCFRRLGHLHYTAVESFNVVMSVMIAVLAFIIVVSCFFGCMTLLCRAGGWGIAGARKPAFEPMPSFESPPLDPTEKQPGFGKKRAKRGAKGGEEEGMGDVECVAMQFRRDRSEDGQ